MWLVGSNGTSPATGESGSTFSFSIGGVDYGSGGSIVAVNANQGLYSCNFVASKVSVLGPGFVYYGSANALVTATPIEVVGVDHFDTTRFGLIALPNAVASAAGGLLTFGTGAGQINPSLGSVDAQYLDLSSKFTVGVGKIAAANYSGVSVEVKLGGIQTVSIASATYSGVTFGANPVGDKTLYSVNSIVAANYSGVTVEIGNSGVTAGQAIADRIILRSPSGGTDSGRSIGDALRVLRNQVVIGASIGTVYQEDDVTSAWTFSITTTANAVFLTGINPAGGSA